MAKAILKTSTRNGHFHTYDDTKSGQTSLDNEHRHRYTVSAESNVTIFENAGHNHSPAKSKGVYMKYDVKILPIEDLKVANKEGNLIISGYANTKGTADLYGDIPTVFNRDFVYDLINFKKNPVMLINHTNKVENIAGSFIKLEEDEKGLFVEGKFSNSDLPLIKHAREIYKEGHAKALSIAGKFLYEDTDNPKHLTLAKIFEISLVPVPADPNSLAVAFEKAYKELNEKKEVEKPGTEIKELETVKSLSELETFLKTKGISNKEALTVISKVKQFSNRDGNEKTQRDAGIWLKEINIKLEKILKK